MNVNADLLQLVDHALADVVGVGLHHDRHQLRAKLNPALRSVDHLLQPCKLRIGEPVAVQRVGVAVGHRPLLVIHIIAVDAGVVAVGLAIHIDALPVHPGKGVAVNAAVHVPEENTQVVVSLAVVDRDRVCWGAVFVISGVIQNKAHRIACAYQRK